MGGEGRGEAADLKASGGVCEVIGEVSWRFGQVDIWSEPPKFQICNSNASRLAASLRPSRFGRKRYGLGGWQEFVRAQIRPRIGVPLPPLRGTHGAPGSQGLKSVPERRRATCAAPRPEPQSLPSAHWPALSGFLLFPPRHWSGAGFFSPQSFSSSPLPLPRPTDRSAPPAPSSQEGRNLGKKKKKKFPRSLDQRKDGKTKRGRGRGRREREREERERIKKR